MPKISRKDRYRGLLLLAHVGGLHVLLDAESTEELDAVLKEALEIWDAGRPVIVSVMRSEDANVADNFFTKEIT